MKKNVLTKKPLNVVQKIIAAGGLMNAIKEGQQ